MPACAKWATMAKKGQSKVLNSKSKADKAVNADRRIKQPQYRSFRISKRIKQPKPALIGGFRLFVMTLKGLYKNKRLFGGILIIAFILNVLLVRGLSSATSLTDLKGVLDGIFTGTSGKFTSGAALFAVLVGGSGSAPTEIAGVYQSFLFILFSLAYIWALRQTSVVAAGKLRIRDPFYKGMYPLIPFVLVLGVIGLQLLPLAAANFLYAVVITGGLAVTLLEQALWLVLIFLLATLSLYMVSSSIFAFYIVTLADMTPLQALRSARELVRFRRWSIVRKLLVLPFCLMLIGALIVIPLIIISPALAEWIFYILSIAALPVLHAYMYQLYRKLL